jgi:hypothetical protein
VKHVGEFTAEDWNSIHLVRLNLTRVAELLVKYEEKRPGAKPVKGAKK